ncbi:MAG: serine/threonine protein kinase [Roseiflexaceae bacterium]
MSTPTTLPPLQGRYQIESRLGASRLAVVYRAYDQRLQRPVLVHLLRRELADQPALAQRFRQEAQYSAARTHRSLLDVYDTGELAGRPFLITEYVSGRSLRELGQLSLEDALLYFRQVVGAVATCQTAGVPHPPISSNNVVVVEDGHVELVESWLVQPEDVARDLACYRPPERASGAPLTNAGAVYSLGLLFVELITGQRVVNGSDPHAVAQAHLSMQVPSIAQLRPSIYAPALDALIQRATARNPQQRFADASTFGQALDQLRQSLAGDTVQFRVVESAPSMGEQVRRSTGRLLRPVAAYAPLPRVMRDAVSAAEDDERDQRGRAELRDPSRAWLGLGIMAIMFFVAICGAYQLGSLALEELTNIRTPRLEVPANMIDLGLPEWLTGTVEGEGELFEIVINSSEGLNLRSQPGVQQPILTLLPNGTQVRRIDGPKIVDGIPWMHVRVRINGQNVEGWISANYIKAVS